MKLGLLSDCHLESEASLRSLPELLPKHGSVDAYLIAGDATKAQLVTEFCVMARDVLGCPIVYIPGNHEYYYGAELQSTMDELDERWREEFAAHEDIHFLQNESVTIGTANIFGSTWWTNFEALGTDVMETSLATADLIADFRFIKTRAMKPTQIRSALERYRLKTGIELTMAEFKMLHGNKRFLETITPEYMMSLHQKSLSAYKRWHRQAEGTKVLMAHFPMIKPLAHGFYPPHPYFVSADDCFIDQYPPDLLLFGHTHYNHDLSTRGIRCLSNMLGYTNEKAQAGYRRDLVIEI
jgi:predicted phosphodiesterase